jgi:hypothetical protein
MQAGDVLHAQVLTCRSVADGFLEKEKRMVNLQKHMALLGLRVEDRITGFTGIVVCVSFDLYGCIQAVVNPGTDKEGKPRDSVWFDVSRLKVTDPTPVMPVPDFDYGPVAEGKKGPAEKPLVFKP